MRGGLAVAVVALAWRCQAAEETCAESACADAYPSCYRWMQDGACERLAKFMERECAASCGQCEGTVAADPCEPVNDAVGPGSINETFTAAAALDRFKPSMLSTDPPIVVFDDFADAEEASELASLAEEVGFGASGSSCGFKRSSCNSASMSCLPVAAGSCWSHAPMRRLEERMLEVLGVPRENCEPLRFFRYSTGETFAPHHDADGQIIPRHTPGGPRVWSLYVFLAAPDGGGAFSFPRLNLSVPPKPGRAVLWPHLRDDDLITPDERTEHTGAPVTSGVKYGVNLHAHRNQLRTHVLGGCSDGGGVQHTFHYQTTPGASVLHDLVGMQAGGAVPALLAAGADVNASDDSGLTPLHLAAARGMLETTRTLLEAGAEANAADSGGATPLHHAAWQGQVEAVRALLLNAAVSPGVTDAKGVTPLHLASRHGQLDAASVLLEAGADAGAASDAGATPLHFAARRGETAMAKLLLAAGVDPAAADATGASPLHLAASEGHAETSRVLMEGGAQPDAPGGRGMTPLHLAAAKGSLEVASVLIETGANVDVEDSSGATPLHFAARQGENGAVSLLLAAGAAASAADSGGSTALHIAAWKGHVEVVDALLKAGAEPKKADRQGNTPVAVAERFGHKEVAKLLASKPSRRGLW